MNLAEILDWFRQHPQEADRAFRILMQEGILKLPHRPLGRPATGISRKQYGLRVTGLEERLTAVALYAFRWKDKTCHPASRKILSYYQSQSASQQLQILQHPIPAGAVRPVRQQKTMRLTEMEYIVVCTALYGYRYAVEDLAATITFLLRYYDGTGKEEQDTILKRRQPSRLYQAHHAEYQES